MVGIEVSCDYLNTILNKWVFRLIFNFSSESINFKSIGRVFHVSWAAGLKALPPIIVLVSLVFCSLSTCRWSVASLLEFIWISMRADTADCSDAMHGSRVWRFWIGYNTWLAASEAFPGLTGNELFIMIWSRLLPKCSAHAATSIGCRLTFRRVGSCSNPVWNWQYHKRTLQHCHWCFNVQIW